MTSPVPSTHRLGRTPSLSAPFPGGWVAILAGALIVGGCAVDAPEAPQFETQLFLPFGVRTSTGLDLIDDEGYIEGDSAGAGPLQYVLRGTVEESQVGAMLNLELPTAWSTFGLGGVRLTSARPLRADILLPSVCDQFGPVPRETLNVSIAPFTIAPVIRAVGPPQDVSWVRLQRGLVRLTLRNRLPVPLGGAGGAPPRVRLRDRGTGASLAIAEFAAPIDPGAEGVTETRLDGVEIASDLDLELSGSSPGSGTGLVDVHVTDQIELEASFIDLVADSAYAAVPAQSFTTSDSIRIAEEMDISEGVVRYGTIRFTIRNPYPVAGTARATLPSVFRTADSSEPVFVVIDLPAAVGDAPGWGGATLDLAGAVMRPTGGFERSLTYVLTVESQPSNGSVRLGTNARALGAVDPAGIAFDSVRGRLDRRRFSLRATWTDFDPPAGIDSLSFTSATLGLQITSTIAFPVEAELDLMVVPADGGDRFSVPVRLSILAAAGAVPRVTRFSVDESNSQVLDLLAARPRRILVSGVLYVGGGEEGTIHRTDGVWGEYALTAPLRARIPRGTHRTNPSSFTVDPDDQDLIRDHIRGASARGTVTNHFPAGLEVRLVFAGSEADLALDPASQPDHVLVLGPVVVAPGETDPMTGRVVRSRESPLEVAIGRDRVSFFARDRVYSQAVLVVSGEDSTRIVEVTALDFVEVAATLNFRVWVRP